MFSVFLFYFCQQGRGGKGVIYTWAAGNGDLTDNCNGDGYVNSIYTIGVTSVEEGQNAWYSEVCAASLAATYGGSSNNRYLVRVTIYRYRYPECTIVLNFFKSLKHCWLPEELNQK